MHVKQWVWLASGPGLCRCSLLVYVRWNAWDGFDCLLWCEIGLEEPHYSRKAGTVFAKTLRSVPVPLRTSKIRFPNPLISLFPLFKHVKLKHISAKRPRSCPVSTVDLGVCVHVKNARCCELMWHHISLGSARSESRWCHPLASFPLALSARVLPSIQPD